MQHLDNYAAFDLLNTAKEYDTARMKSILAIDEKSPSRYSELTINKQDDPTQPVQKRIRMSGEG